MAAMLLVGRSFEKGFVYLGAGPSLSRIQGSLDDVVGFATINGNLTSISGAPQSFSSSDWRSGAAVTAGLTYFLTSSWFLDVSYLFIAPKSRTIFVTSPFNNPGDGTVSFSGTLIGIYTANVRNTQAVAISINKAL
jgi:opacity protein-like surface antigen